MIVPGSSLADSVAVLEHTAQQPAFLFPAVGVHPHLAKEWDEGSAARLQALAADPRVVAIGETGLDYHRNLSPRARQLHALETHIRIAEEIGLPLFLHQRSAHHDLIAALRGSRVRNAVVHCFTDNRDALDDYLALDLYIGITGWICDERRGTHLEELVKIIPADRLLIETDAPYLVPRNLSPARRPRDRRNEPAFLAHIAAHVARCRGVRTEEIARRTSDNARRLFGITLPPTDLRPVT